MKEPDWRKVEKTKSNATKDGLSSGATFLSTDEVSNCRN